MQSILGSARELNEVAAVFLKGSMAKGEEDEYSDVDIYCVVADQDLASFLGKRLSILQSYGEILYHSEADFVGPQVVVVYANGLHVDLYTVTPESIPKSGTSRPLYDPQGLLALQASREQDHSLTWGDICRHFGEFSFSLLEFHAAWCRRDLLWSMRLASHLAGDLGVVLRTFYDPANGRLGTKRLERHMPQAERDAMRQAVAMCHGSQTLSGVLALCDIMRTVMCRLELQQGKSAVWGLFDHMVVSLHKAEPKEVR